MRVVLPLCLALGMGLLACQGATKRSTVLDRAYASHRLGNQEATLDDLVEAERQCRWECEWYRGQIGDLEQQERRLVTENQTRRDNLEAAQREQAALQKSFDKVKADREALTKQLTPLQAEVAQKTKDLAQATAEKERLTKALALIEPVLTGARAAMETRKADLVTLKRQIEEALDAASKPPAEAKPTGKPAEPGKAKSPGSPGGGPTEKAGDSGS